MESGDSGIQTRDPRSALRTPKHFKHWRPNPGIEPLRAVIEYLEGGPKSIYLLLTDKETGTRVRNRYNVIWNEIRAAYRSAQIVPTGMLKPEKKPITKLILLYPIGACFRYHIPFASHTCI